MVTEPIPVGDALASDSKASRYHKAPRDALLEEVVSDWPWSAAAFSCAVIGNPYPLRWRLLWDHWNGLGWLR